MINRLEEGRKFKGYLNLDNNVVDPDPLAEKIAEGERLLADHIEKGVDPKSDIVIKVKKVILELKMGTVKWNREHDKRHLKAYIRGAQWFHHGRDVNGKRNWFPV